MEKTGPSFAVRALAVIVLLLAAWFLLRVVIGLVAGIAWIVAGRARGGRDRLGLAHALVV